MELVLVLSILGFGVTVAAPVPLALVDMTHVFDRNIIYRPDTERFRHKVTNNGTTEEGYWLQIGRYSSGIHVGTHMDAPCHFKRGGLCVDEIPLDQLIGPVAVIDITEKANKDCDALMEVEDLQNWEMLSKQSLNGTIVMVRSGWGRRWSNREAYLGTTGNDVTQLHFPGTSRRAAQWLVDNRSIKGLGTDALALDNGLSQEFWAHRILLGADLFGVENVANMEMLPIYGATIYLMPMKIAGASGASVRIIATYPIIA